MDETVSTQSVGPIDKLPPEGLDEIHEASLRLLEDVGLRISYDEALDLLDENGCDVDRESNIVRFPPDLVEESIEKAPSSFTLHGRNPEQSVQVGDGEYVTSPCGSAPNVLTYEDGRRPSTLEDYETLQKLTQMTDVMTTTGYNHCEPNDVDQEVKHYRLLERAIKLSDKPLKGDCWGADRAKASIEMAGIANQDPDLSKPYMFATINSVSPRIWDTKMTGGLLEFARAGQVAVLSPAVMASASGPSTLAGTLALGNAEILAGNVMAQLANPGTPIVYGLPTSNVDVRYGSFAIGSPEGALCVAFAGQMGRYYDVPSRAGGSLTDAKVPDAQAGAESMLQLFVTVQSGVNLIHHAVGMLDSYSTSSPEKFVIDCESLRYIEHFRNGYDINTDTLAEDLVADVEPGGHFLNQRHTLEHSRDDYLFSDMFYRDSYDNWADEGEKDAFEVAHERVEEMLDEYERPELDPEVAAELEAYVEEGVEGAYTTA
ncbi:trimethylamine methyltransferase family protein [Haloarculaceae archaeon H-GB1-1]|nr:trimethylamine methyltransferase family protein [Haloarculaceae archaeon H-GB1-1]